MKRKIADIKKTFEENHDSKKIKIAKKSYPTKAKVIGVTVPNLRNVLKELKKQTKHYSNSERLKLVKELNKTNIFECQQLAFKYIENDKGTLRELTEKDIDELGERIDNWVTADNYGALVVGYSWREGIISTDKIKSYLKSDDFWIRRIAIVATVSLNQKARGGKGDVKQTLEICELVVDDHQDMINKALSWALTQLASIISKQA
ncbi:MAG: DNA alkylation repair protein [Desulfobacteraceae bacterium]|nr:DNA alkylation repair protein [Desulfobacteraceae bacterium]